MCQSSYLSTLIGFMLVPVETVPMELNSFDKFRFSKVGVIVLSRKARGKLPSSGRGVRPSDEDGCFVAAV